MPRDRDQTSEAGPLFKLIEKLRWDSDIGKFKHFNAAHRCRTMQVCTGLPVVMINIIAGSSLFASLQEKVPSVLLLAGGILALIGAVLAAIQTFFRFGEAYEVHHKLGNAYAAVVRDIEELVACYQADLATKSSLVETYRKLRSRYGELVKKGEAHITSRRDYRIALRRARNRSDQLKTAQTKAFQPDPK